MAKIEDCPGFETFGSDVKAAREALNISRRALAEQVSIDPRYLANIELEQTVPSVPVVLQLIRICKLPVERYFNPSLIAENTEQRQRVNDSKHSKCSHTCGFFPFSGPLPENKKSLAGISQTLMKKGRYTLWRTANAPSFSAAR